MKGLKLILVVLNCFILNSCNYLFRPEEYYLSNIETDQELELAVDAVNDYFLIYLNEISIQNSELFSDDQFVVMNDGSPSSPEAYEGYYSLRDGVKGNENFSVNVYDWMKAYSIIASINNILSQFDPNSIENRKTVELLGELIFLRAYLHYRLTLIYGEIPIVTNNEVSYTISKPSYKEIYEFIEEELLTAMGMLPQNNAAGRIPFETPDRGCAKALLGEVYLSWAGFPVNDVSKYKLAAEVTEEIIDSSSFYHYELLRDFEDVWSNKMYYNNEAVFCKYIDFTKMENSRYKARYIFVSELRGGGFGFDGIGRLSLINGCPIPEIEFYNTYPQNYRKEITFFTRIYVDSMSIYGYPYFPEAGLDPDDSFNPLIEAGLDTGYFDIRKTDFKSRAAYRKFFIDTTFSSEGYRERFGQYLFGCHKIYLIRYAQTLLTYAEASARSGNLNEKSYECINKIRRRANHLPLDSPSPYDLADGLSAEAFTDSVVQERAWELAGEIGHRWFDMVRTQTVEKVFEKRDPNDGGSFEYSTNDKYFFPIPEHDINLNPNLSN